MTRQPRSLRYRSQQLDLHYVEWSDEAALPLILVHGGNDQGCANCSPKQGPAPLIRN